MAIYKTSLAIAALIAPLALAGCVTVNNYGASDEFAESANAEVEEATDNGTAMSQIMLDQIAKRYIVLTLGIGEHEPGYVDAYYGAPEYQKIAKNGALSLADLAQSVDDNLARLDLVESMMKQEVEGGLKHDYLLFQRVTFMRAQLTAAKTRLRMLQGEKLSFREEALGQFGAVPELVPLTEFDPILAKLDKMVPGEGDLAKRVTNWEAEFVIQPERLKPVFDAAIAECRKRTMAHFSLPESESFTLEFVTDKSWSGYNYYQGNFHSLIQVNTDMPISISRAVDLGCHEGYPGHHVFNMLLEKNLTRDRDWQEFSVYPLYSPMSLIAEGSANYGIELAFPGREKIIYERDVLFPLAGLDPARAEEFERISSAKEELGRARFTIAQQFLDGEITREQAEKLSQKYLLQSPAKAKQAIQFTTDYRSYVINYGLGQDMVRSYIEAAGNDPKARWQAMYKILSEPTLPKDLVVE